MRVPFVIPARAAQANSRLDLEHRAQTPLDTLCMIYGRDPKQNSKLLNNDRLPDERAEICEKDYQRIDTAWKTLLKPYAKESLWQSP